MTREDCAIDRIEEQSEPGTFPPREGNSIELLVNGDQIFRSMLRDIRAAESSICFESFIYWDGTIGAEFCDAFALKAEEGVKVRIVLDWVGSFKLSQSLVRKMIAAGVKIAFFRPLKWRHLRRFNHRSHRKLLIVDDLIGFIGGVGIADEWRGVAQDPDHWRDNHYRVTGPIVEDLRDLFYAHWDPADPPGKLKHPANPKLTVRQNVTMQAIAAEPAVGKSRIHDTFLAAVLRAKTRIGIVTPYFMPGKKLLAALRHAKRQGVSVEIITCGKYIDQRIVRKASRHSWGSLLTLGIEIHEFQPTLLHAKALIIDDCEIFVGSANFDSRSSLMNSEANLLISDRALTETHWGLFEQDKRRSQAVTIQSWQNRSWFEKLIDRLAFFFRDQL